MILLAVITLCIFTFIAWTDFRRAIIVFAALLPTYLIRFQIGPVPTTLLELLWIVLIGVWMLKSRQISWEQIRPWVWPMMLWLVAGLIGVIVAPDLRAALGIYKAYFIEPVALFAIVEGMMDDVLRRRITIVLMISGAIIATYALLQKFILGAPFLWEGTRATSVYPFPNAIGLFLAPLILLSFEVVKEKTYRWPALAATAVMLAGIIVAENEGALVGIAAGFFFLGIIHRRTRLATIIATITFVVAVIITPAVRGPVIEKLTLRDWSGTVRRLTWEETTAMLKDRPFFGAGLSGYPARLAPYHHYKIEIFQYPHQLFLNLWSEVGVLGMIAFGWILVAFGRLAWRQKGARPYAIAAMITILVHGLVDVPYFKNDLAFLFWIIIALGVGFTKTNKSATVAAH